MATNESYFIQDFKTVFGTYKIEDEEIHDNLLHTHKHHALTETQYFGFCVPDKSIHAFLYLWYHPNLDVVSAGPMIFKGKKSISLASELIDYRQYVPASQLGKKLTDFRLENSYAVKMIEPGRKFRLTYDDPSRKNAYDLTYTAVSDPMVWASGRHFEQVMKVEGDLYLRGEHHEVEGFNIRDRSWGEARLETPMAGPPAVWSVGTFGEDFAFNVTAFDDPQRDPMWKDQLPHPEKSFKFGWMIVDGEPVIIANSSNVVGYDPATLMPDNIQLNITDIRGRDYVVTGTVTARVPFNTWLNARVPVCQTRWECNGRVGWGDIQECQWNDFLEAFHPNAA